MDQQSGPCRREIRSFMFLTTGVFKFGSGVLIEKGVKTDVDSAGGRTSKLLCGAIKTKLQWFLYEKRRQVKKHRNNIVYNATIKSYIHGAP